MIRGHRRAEHELRVPLHAEHVARTAPADGFDDVVGNRERFDVEPAAELIDRLVMDRVDRRFSASGIQLGEPAAGHEAHFVKRLLIAFGITVHKRFRHRGADVLMQRAAERDVDQLTTAADPEHRLAFADERLEQFDFVAIAHTIALPLGRQRLLAVALRREIGTALQHQAVEVLRVRGQAHVADRVVQRFEEPLGRSQIALASQQSDGSCARPIRSRVEVEILLRPLQIAELLEDEGA